MIRSGYAKHWPNGRCAISHTEWVSVPAPYVSLLCLGQLALADDNDSSDPERRFYQTLKRTSFPSPNGMVGTHLESVFAAREFTSKRIRSVGRPSGT